MTYGNERFEKSKKRIQKQAEEMGIFDDIFILSPSDLPNDLPTDTQKILKQTKGGGYYVWKPIITKKILDTLNTNDILIYVDSGCTLHPAAVDKLLEYIELVKHETKPILKFQMEHLPEYKYTTSTVFRHFNVLNNNKITDSGQHLGGIFILRKCDISVNIIQEWYTTAIQHPLLFTDVYNHENKHPQFIDSRHDQSIFSVISKINQQYCNVLSDRTYPYNAHEPICATRIRE
jgi:hypothetical protein